MIDLIKSNLEYMKIYGLFGQKNIYIDFHEKINIFIGENGLGKTTILSFVYNVLKIKTNYQKLLSTNFESFEIKFKGDSDVLKVSKSDIKDFSSKSDFRYFKNKSYIYEYLEAEVAMCDGVIDDEMFNYIVSKIMRRFGYPRSYVSRLFKEYLETGSMNSYTKQMSSGNQKKVINLINKLSSNISEIVMYLPTYRRIENEFSFSMDTRNQPNNELIKFGMRDVNIAINEKLNAILSAEYDEIIHTERYQKECQRNGRVVLNWFNYESANQSIFKDWKDTKEELNTIESQRNTGWIFKVILYVIGSIFIILPKIKI